MNRKTLYGIFGGVFLVALIYLIATGFVTNLTGNVVGDGRLEKAYSEEFSGTVAESKTFDLGKVVTVDELDISWTDNMNTCWGQIKVSKDGENWFTKQSWKDVPSPAKLILSAIGDIRYIMFEESSCAEYTVSNMKVTGTYVEQAE